MFPKETTDHGDAWDPEDGMLEGLALAWSVDIGEPFPGSMPLGHGEELDIPGSLVPPGCQLITLIATDSDGRTGTDSVAVDINATGCLGSLFGDGFESGDVSLWSTALP